MTPTTSADALSQLESYQNTEKAPQDILSGQETALGVPGQQQQVSGLRQAITNTTNLLNQVAPSVYGRTQNSLVTTAQAGRQIGNEEAPIQSKLSGLNTAEGNAASDLNTNLSRAGTLASLEQQGQSTKESNLKDLYTALYGQEQDKAKADSDAAAQAEQAREFNVSQSNKGASGGSGGLSPAQQKAMDQSQTLQNLQSVQGGDKHVNEANWSKAMNDWIGAGYSAADFVKNFGSFVNPKYSSTYQGAGQFF